MRKPGAPVRKEHILPPSPCLAPAMLQAAFRDPGMKKLYLFNLKILLSRPDCRAEIGAAVLETDNLFHAILAPAVNPDVLDSMTAALARATAGLGQANRPWLDRAQHNPALRPLLDALPTAHGRVAWLARLGDAGELFDALAASELRPQNVLKFLHLPSPAEARRARKLFAQTARGRETGPRGGDPNRRLP